MNKKIVTLTLLVAIIGLLVIIVVGSHNKDRQITQIDSEITQESGRVDETNAEILYWGNTCPHCHDTIEWIEENKIEDKISIVRKEVYDNQANSLELTAQAKKCGLPTNSVGVPFMYTTQGECLIGTPDITSYLEQKANQENIQAENASPAANIQKGE